MAYVYADMDALLAYQQQIVQSLATLGEAAESKNDLIEETVTAIRAAIQRAEAAERAAKAALWAAQDELLEAEQRTRQRNANLGEDEEPATTPSFYYEEVAEKTREHAMAQSDLDRLEKMLADFEACVRRYRRQQLEAIRSARKLVRSSAVFFDRYVRKLNEAKRCTVVFGEGGSGESGTQSRAGSQGAGQGSYREYFEEGSEQAALCPNGILFTPGPNGKCYPRFEEWAIAIVKFDFPSPEGVENKTCLSGQYVKDKLIANKKFGFPDVPEGHVWHHVEDMQTMILVPQSIHSVIYGGVSHVGGASLIRSYLKGK